MYQTKLYQNPLKVKHEIETKGYIWQTDAYKDHLVCENSFKFTNILNSFS